MEPIHIMELTCQELAERLKTNYGKGMHHAQALLREIIRHGNRDFHTADEFMRSPKLTRLLSRDLVLPEPEITRIVSEEGTVKFAMKLACGSEVESVVIPMRNHNTLCLSCQVGCRMGCRFCETGHMGFVRNLTPGEMAAQVFAARFIVKKNIKNIVFMGMGEPLDNFDAVRRAIVILSDQRGFDIARSHITVSTAGLVSGIDALGRSGLNVHLAVSLNASNDRIRESLMPVAFRHSMEDIRQALFRFPLGNRGLFLIGYVLIPGLNDSEEQALELAEYLKPLPVRVNVIPLNKTSAFNRETASDDDVHRFASYLEKQGVFVVKRWSRGSRLQAGCGQLGNADGASRVQDL